MWEFKVVRKYGENIFFVAYRQKSANLDRGLSIFTFSPTFPLLHLNYTIVFCYVPWQSHKNTTGFSVVFLLFTYLFPCRLPSQPRSFQDFQCRSDCRAFPLRVRLSVLPFVFPQNLQVYPNSFTSIFFGCQCHLWVVGYLHKRECHSENLPLNLLFSKQIIYKK